MADRKQRYDGPTVRQRSDGEGRLVYEMIRGAVAERDAPEFYLKKEEEVGDASTRTPRVCAITGLLAKYRDPKTGLYYATFEAFKKLQLQHDTQKRIDEGKIENRDETSEQKENEENTPRRSIWDAPIPGELTHREIAQQAKKKAEVEEAAALATIVAEQEATRAERKKQVSKKQLASRKVMDVKKARAAMLAEEKSNAGIRGPGRWLSLKTILARPELDVPCEGMNYPRPVLIGFSKPGIPEYVVPTPIGKEKPLDDEVDTGTRMIDSSDIMAVKTEEEEELDAEMTNSDEFTIEEASEDDFDDEGTIEEDERAALEEDDECLNLTAEEEKNALEEEANLSIEEILRRYQSQNRCFGEKPPSPSPEASSDFEGVDDEGEDDDETTLEEDAKALVEEAETVEEERNRLEKEAEIPIEELMKRYRNGSF